jgi:phytoene synthase
VDEIVDGPDVDPDPAVQRAALEEWNTRLDRMYRGDVDNTGLDNFDVAFRDMVASFPGSDIEPYRDMVRGMVMDIDQDVYATWDDLYLYCYRVASTVGLMTLPVMGTAQGVTIEEAREPAVALGIALQITNILRDVGEDARDRGRIYLPQADLQRFGVTPESILERAKNGGKPDDNYKELMKFEIARAREYYRQAEAGIALLAPGAQLPVAVAAELYKNILDKIEANDYDNFNTRAYLTGEEKMLKVPPLWLKTVTGGWEEVRQKAKASSV